MKKDKKDKNYKKHRKKHQKKHKKSCHKKGLKNTPAKRY